MDALQCGTTLTRLVTVEVFYDLSEAVVARSMLQGYGVTAFLFDYHLVSVSWIRLHAVQGLRLCVPGEEREAVQALLATKDEAMLGGAVAHCPTCGSGNIFRAYSWIATAFSFVVIFPVLIHTKRRRCRRCGHRWRES